MLTRSTLSLPESFTIHNLITTAESQTVPLQEIWKSNMLMTILPFASNLTVYWRTQLRRSCTTHLRHPLSFRSELMVSHLVQVTVDPGIQLGRDLGRGILRARHGFPARSSFSGRHSGSALQILLGFSGRYSAHSTWYINVRRRTWYVGTRRYPEPVAP